MSFFPSSSNYSNSYSNILLPTLSNFEFPSSEQIASDIIHFLVQASPHTIPNKLQLVVLENMLIKRYKQSLISHIDFFQVAVIILILTAIFYFRHFQILNFLHLNKLQVILFIFSFKLRHIHYQINYS